MELNEFVSNFADQFEDASADQFAPETNFREFEGWSSLVALSVLAMIDEEYDVAVPANEIVPANFNSAQAIYDMIQRLK